MVTASTDTPTRNPERHPVNIRFSMPLLGRRYFLAVVGGSETRSPERRATERQIHPIRTASNVLFIIGFAALFYIVAFMAIALQSSIIEF